MRRTLGFAATLVLIVVGMHSTADALSIASPPLTVGATPSAIPPGNTFQVSGHCQQEAPVTIHVVRQARPGVAARVVQRRTVSLDSERNYATTFTNDLTTAAGFPVDAQIFATCGEFTAHAPFVSTSLVYPNNNPRIMTLQDNGPCGTCVAHLKGFDAFANLTTSHNFYLKEWTRSGSLAGRATPDYTSYIVGSGPGKRATVDIPPLGISPYGDFAGGVEVVWADVFGDTGFDVVTGPGAGGGPHVKIFSSSRPSDPNEPFLAFAPPQEVGGFFAYPASFTGGVRVAVGDVFGDTKPEIITAAGPGGGPHIRVFTANGSPISEFFAYAADVTGGVSIAVGDVVPGGKQEIVTGAGPGGAAHVKTFNYIGQALSNGFYAYDPGFTGGAWVAVGNVDGQGADDIVTGAGAGGMPHVRWFTSIDGASTNPGFFAYEDLPTGVRVAVPRD